MDARNNDDFVNRFHRLESAICSAPIFTVESPLILPTVYANKQKCLLLEYFIWKFRFFSKNKDDQQNQSTRAKQLSCTKTKLFRYILILALLAGIIMLLVLYLKKGNNKIISHVTISYDFNWIFIHKDPTCDSTK